MFVCSLEHTFIYELTAEIRMKIEDRRKQGDLPALTNSDKFTNSISATFLGEKTESSGVRMVFYDIMLHI